MLFRKQSIPVIFQVAYYNNGMLQVLGKQMGVDKKPIDTTVGYFVRHTCIVHIKKWTRLYNNNFFDYQVINGRLDFKTKIMWIFAQSIA